MRLPRPRAGVVPGLCNFKPRLGHNTPNSALLPLPFIRQGKEGRIRGWVAGDGFCSREPAPPRREAGGASSGEDTKDIPAVEQNLNQQESVRRKGLPLAGREKKSPAMEPFEPAWWLLAISLSRIIQFRKLSENLRGFRTRRNS